MIEKPEALTPDGLRLAAQLLDDHAADMDYDRADEARNAEQIEHVIAWLRALSYEAYYPCAACKAQRVTFDRLHGYVCQACGQAHVLDIARPGPDAPPGFAR